MDYTLYRSFLEEFIQKNALKIQVFKVLVEFSPIKSSVYIRSSAKTKRSEGLRP